MKSLFLKVTSVCVATAVIAAMGITTLADELPDSGVVEGSTLGEEVGSTLTFYKGIMAYNPETVTIPAPNIKYTYSIAAGDADKQITDDAGVSVYTKAGNMEAVTFSGNSVEWTNSDTLNASSEGVENYKSMDISFDSTKYTAAGVYRYKISESVTPANKAAAGVTDGGISDVRYLDVYVRDGDTAGEYVIYGYVMFENNLDHLDGRTGAASGTTTKDAVKTKGFVDASDPSGSTSTDLTSDSYYTYNATVGKTLENDNTNINNQFPFYVAFKNSTISQDVKIDYLVSAPATLASLDAGKLDSSTGLTSEPTIANGGTVKYIGIPCGTTVEVYEKNNVQTASYNSKCENADTQAATKLINYDVESNTASVYCEADKAGSAKDITFVNTLVLISPTGVALAVLPFVILLGFGIVFMVVGTTKRKEDQA